jgi:nitronate monooxygenase
VKESSVPSDTFLARLGIRHPVILAPMGGGPGTPELVAAVSNAGGLGSLGAAYLTPEQITDAARRIRALTDRPFNVNLFAGGYETKRHVDPAPMLAHLAAIHAALGLPAPSAPVATADPFPAQLDAVLAARPAVFSFTFGIPAPEAMARVRAHGMIVLGTATTVEEARMLAVAGVDGIVAQGAEAGAHRGTFEGRFEDAMMPTRDLVRGIVDRVQVPVIASGGIMDGAEIAASLALGAAAAQLGTAFLTCPESGASAAYKKAILDAHGDTTVITRAFSGRPARGLENAFITGLAGKEETILPYPIQNALTRPMRTAAGQRGDARYLSLWAGTGVARARPLPAGELVRTLMAEASAALGRPAFS